MQLGSTVYDTVTAVASDPAAIRTNALLIVSCVFREEI